jgi:hypothetical protein
MLLLALALTGCTKTAPDDTDDSDGTAAEICDNGADDDGDGDADCDDSDCVDDDACRPGAEDCTNGVDDDGDGDADCADDDCECVEDCVNGVDDDDDGDVDCDDADCELDPACAPETESECDDGVDNDLDTLVDCEDVDCTDACPEDCGDGVDNDADGFIDCFDNECNGSDACVEVCDDGLDNDGDGFLDCEDSECVGDAACDEDCTDGVDNDLDTFTDCDDDDCWGQDACANRTVQTTGFASMGGPYRQRQAYWYRSGASGYSYGGTVEFTHSEVVTDVTGTLAIERGTAVVECGWTVDTATFSQQLTWSYGASTSAIYYMAQLTNLQNRSGWATSGDCGGVDSGVLPGQLMWDTYGLFFLSGSSSGYPTAGGLWYAGAFDYTLSYFGTERYSETAAGGYYGYYSSGVNAEVWWEPTGAGDPWTVTGL